MAIAVFYEIFQKEVLADLKSYTKVIGANYLYRSDFLEYETNDSEVRVTLIDEEGNVKFDSYANEGEMGNHKERPEVRDAMILGEGEDIRRSATLDTSTFYYAMKLEDGMIIRVGKEVQSMLSVFESGCI